MKHLLSALMIVILVAIALVAFALPALASDGSSGPSAATIVNALVVAWGFVAPLTVYKWIPAEDGRMKAVTIGVSVVIALAALFFTGQLHPDLSSAAGAFVFFSMVYGESQLVWNLAKDSRPKLVS